MKAIESVLTPEAKTKYDQISVPFCLTKESLLFLTGEKYVLCTTFALSKSKMANSIAVYEAKEQDT